MYTVTHSTGREVIIHQMGDVVSIPKYVGGLLQYTKNGIDKVTGEPLYMPDTRPYQFKLPQKMQNRNKYTNQK